MPKKLATKTAIRLLRHAILARSAKLNLVSLNHRKTPDGSCRMFIDWNFLCGVFSVFASYNAIRPNAVQAWQMYRVRKNSACFVV